MTTFEFHTPPLDASRRDPQTLTVDLCGDSLALDRPKDWTLQHLRTVASTGPVPLNERGISLIKFFNETLDPEEYARFLARCFSRADPLNIAALLILIRDITARWQLFHDHYQRHGTRLPDHQNPPITITAPPGGISGDEITLIDPNLGLDHVTARPPKDLTIMIMYALIAAGAADRWCIEWFLGVILPHHTANGIVNRLSDQNDPLDSSHLDPILAKMLDHWSGSVQIPEHLLTDDNTPAQTV